MVVRWVEQTAGEKADDLAEQKAGMLDVPTADLLVGSTAVEKADRKGRTLDE